MYFDLWHKVGADCGQIWAYRAMTDDLRLAIDMAKVAWAQRRAPAPFGRRRVSLCHWDGSLYPHARSLAALAMKIELQMRFVIHAAMQRHAKAQDGSRVQPQKIAA